MKIFIHAIEKDRISIDVRAESEDGEMVGDLFLEVRPDEKFLSWSFPQLEALSLGEYDLDQGLDVPWTNQDKNCPVKPRFFGRERRVNQCIGYQRAWMGFGPRRWNAHFVVKFRPGAI
jgi:hypothetical protein